MTIINTGIASVVFLLGILITLIVFYKLEK